MRAMLVPDSVNASITMHPTTQEQVVACVKLVPAIVEFNVEDSGQWASGYDDDGDEYTVFAPSDFDPEAFRRLVEGTERQL